MWLTTQQISDLYGRDRSNINRHINNIYKNEELDRNSTCANFAHIEKEKDKYGKYRDIRRGNKEYFNLDIVLLVGYRVNSKQGVAFRKWATKLLKDYTLKGYAINTSKFNLPNIEKISNLLDDARKITGDLQLTGNDMLDFLLSYNKGLKILDDYDHQVLEDVKGNDSTYVLTYDECKRVIENTTFADRGDLFGIEKDNSFKSAIATIYQSYDGVELYPTLEDKAANLLYFITKY